MQNDVLQGKWQDYLFLTREMHKFLVNSDMEVFQTLLKQRLILQEAIQALSLVDGEYNASVEGQTLIRQIHVADQQMQQQFSRVHNLAKRQRSVSQAYDGTESVSSRFINTNT